MQIAYGAAPQAYYPVPMSMPSSPLPLGVVVPAPLPIVEKLTARLKDLVFIGTYGKIRGGQISTEPGVYV